MAIDIFVCGFEHFAPPHSEYVFRCFELPFFLFQTSCSSDKSFVKVLMLRCCVRTVDCSMKGLIIWFVLFGWLLGCMFVVRWFALLYRWVVRSAALIEAGLRAASMSPFWLFIGRIILYRVPLFLVIASLWGVHHMYVM